LDFMVNGLLICQLKFIRHSKLWFYFYVATHFPLQDEVWQICL